MIGMLRRHPYHSFDRPWVNVLHVAPTPPDQPYSMHKVASKICDIRHHDDSSAQSRPKPSFVAAATQARDQPLTLPTPAPDDPTDARVSENRAIATATR